MIGVYVSEQALTFCLGGWLLTAPSPARPVKYKFMSGYKARIDVSEGMIHSALGSILLCRISHLGNSQIDS